MQGSAHFSLCPSGDDASSASIEPLQFFLKSNKESAMHLIWSLIVGLVVGAIAKLLMPGKDPGGFIITALLGIAGSMLAAFLGRSLGLYPEGAVAPGVIASIVGAMILLGIYRVAFRRHVA
jgi:uncharacterized membrane protein YeaQ/YmgE (transglycosylase-associated protein family)